jgi:hypothetical protein
MKVMRVYIWCVEQSVHCLLRFCKQHPILCNPNIDIIKLLTKRKFSHDFFTHKQEGHSRHCILKNRHRSMQRLSYDEWFRQSSLV